MLKYLTPIKSRIELGLLLQQEGFEVGAELGVQRGHFAAETLQRWPKCRRYYLVDIWAPQDNYKDYANVDQAEQDKILAEARQVLTPWQHKLAWLRMTTNQAVRHVREPLDYVYVDARHDYCGTLEDIQAWWPLIRPGGIMAGHDYENAPDVKQATGQDWALCSNGTLHQGAVQSAVNDFFAAQGVQVVVTYRESAWNTWMAKKP
uniref:O-methyltransferase domain-containing protein n=1 Tax=Tetradesmus obliquus TaxID=3088 RepID=A0A383WBA9_TETOB|eukprot:jgi/Sobl393_1/6705/SZX74500.1